MFPTINLFFIGLTLESGFCIRDQNKPPGGFFMPKKRALLLVFTCACLLLCTGTGFAVDQPLSTGEFLNNNSSSAVRFVSAPSAGRSSFNPVDFSLPASSLQRLDHADFESLLRVSDAPVAKPTGPKKKVGKILVIAGLGAAGAGTIMALAAGEPKEIGDSGVGINWRSTGFVWIGVGLAVAIVGFILGSSK
jgi:hypothetical protein